MGTIVDEGEKKVFHLAPAGTIRAACFNYWDLGYQKTTFQGNEKVMPKILIGWEIDERIPDGEYAGKRFAVYKKYTKTLYEKGNLCKDLVSWRGKPFTDQEKKGFDLDNIIGASCLLTIVHNQIGDKTYVNIGAITGLMKGMDKLIVETERTTPDWIKKIQDKAVTKVDDTPHEAAGDEEEVPF